MNENEKQIVENAAKLLTEMALCSGTSEELPVPSAQISSIAYALVGVAYAHKSARGYPTTDDLKAISPLPRMWPDKSPEEIIATSKEFIENGG